MQDEAIEFLHWLNHDQDDEGEAPELAEDNPYRIIASIDPEDPGIWDRAWDEEGMLNACMIVRVGDLGDSLEALEFTSTELLIARAWDAESFDELYWIAVAYKALTFTERGKRMGWEDDHNPIREAIRENFAVLKTTQPDAQSDERDQLQWLDDEGRLSPRTLRPVPEDTEPERSSDEG